MNDELLTGVIFLGTFFIVLMMLTAIPHQD